MVNMGNSKQVDPRVTAMHVEIWMHIGGKALDESWMDVEGVRLAECI